MTAHSEIPQYLFLGSGRASTHLQAYFTHLRLPFRVWSRKFEREPGARLQSMLAEATHVIALVSDSSIEPLVRKAKTLLPSGRTPPLWLHFSGALQTDEAWGCHPLMSFTESGTYSPEIYRSMAFMVDRGAPSFSALLPGLPNSHYKLDPAKKALYHSLCVLSGNFSTLLWNKLFNDLEKRLLIPRSAALPYLQAVSANLHSSPRSALTGPLVRGDTLTLQKDRAALENDPYQEVFDAFVRAYQKESSR